MAASQSRKTTSAKAAAVQYPRPKLACSRGAGCAVSSNAINNHALTSVRKSLIAGTSQDRRPPFFHLSGAQLPHQPQPPLRANSPFAIPRLSLSQLRLPPLGCDTSLHCYARTALSRALFATSQPSHPGLIRPTGSRTHLAASRRFWNRPPTQRRHKRPTCKRGTAA